MKATEILYQDLRSYYPQIHSSRLKTLCTFIESGIKDQRVSVTYLGRGLESGSVTTKKHDSKRADRLIGNAHLHCERHDYYEYMTEQLIGREKHPIILIDWSPINGQEIYQLLRASIPMQGRGLVLYEKTFHESELNTEKAHQSFLDELEQVLPEGCQPVITTDAIYRSPWFKAVELKGWYWIGRVRGQVSLSQDKETWYTSYQWFKAAKVNKAEHLGVLYYGKVAKFKCEGVLFKRNKKGRSAKKKRGGVSQRTTDKTHEKDANEAWLLVFKLPPRYKNNANIAVSLYRQRMQIEENFRDTKNGKLGISLEYANSKSVERFDNLLLIAGLILFIIWCVGRAAVMKKIHYSLQANSLKYRAVLSTIYIGREVEKDGRYTITIDEYVYVLAHLSELAVSMEDLL
ncbi:IS4-like element ISPpr2 family transposase [Photobacterium profundum]|uniref:Transposase n=1 Tax=Photobacterium profundum (strain SS9) TaxID=298386 RepID=Q6LLU8_PHOPR|nr:IS4-like element ISPpr2 family transposase [Photobacterium profundum]CAG21730.1 putative transposase [Photobacterium profundum SS9]